jgi:hypothetical protein
MQKLLLRQLFVLVPVAASSQQVFTRTCQGRHRLVNQPGRPDISRANTYRLSVFTRINFDLLGNTVTKDELRAELERQEQRYKDVYGGEVTTYAAQPEPERKPWRKRASLLDQAFQQELQKMEKDLKEET